MPRLEESDSGHNLHSSRSHGYRQPLSPGRFQVESHRAPPVQPNQQKLGWRTPHRHRQDPQVHPYHQNGIRPYRQCVSHPRELRHRNQDLRRGNASTQPRSPRNARALELYRTPHSECELILGHRLTVNAYLIPENYDTGIKISDAEMRQLNLAPHEMLGRWNYTVRPTQNVN